MEILILFLTGILGAISTYIVANKYKQGAVRASALLSLLVGILFYTFPNIVNIKLATHIPLVFIGASFSGMTSPQILGKFSIIISGIIFSIIYLHTSTFFIGFGGGLGTTACISICITYLIKFIWKNLKNKQPSC